MSDPNGFCASCRNMTVPNAWGCCECGRVVKSPLLDEVAQLRASLATAEQRCADLKLAMGDKAGWFDRCTAERAAHAETKKRERGLCETVEALSETVRNWEDTFAKEAAALARSEARMKAATGILTNVHVMNSQDAGQVVCSSVVEDALEALRND